MDNKEKVNNTIDGMNSMTEKTVDEVKCDKEYFDEPTVIHLDENDSDRDQHDLDDDDATDKKSTLRKRPKDATLLKFSAISCILGVLSCTIFLGNVPLAMIGILFGLAAEANKYKNVYTKIGLICCAIGCIVGFMLITTFIGMFLHRISAIGGEASAAA